MKSNKIRTSVQIDPKLWDTFKEDSKKRKFTFQKLAERSMHMFLTDETFRNQILNHTNTTL